MLPKEFTYDVRGARSENCVLINPKNWCVNTSNMIVEFNSRGGISDTYITEVLATNLPNGPIINKGDLILITNTAAKLYGAYSFSIPINLDSTRYTDIPRSHIIGKFNGDISFNSLQLLGDFILLRRVDNIDFTKSGLYKTTNYTDSVYEVVKKSSDISQNLTKYILCKDNVVTPIMLNSIQYYAVSYKDIIAGFDKINNVLSLNDVSVVYNNYFVVEEAQSTTVSEMGGIYSPVCEDIAAEEWLSESYNEKRFKVCLSGHPSISVGDIIYAIRESFEYCTFGGTKYFVNNNKLFVLAKILGDKNELKN